MSGSALSRASRFAPHSLALRRIRKVRAELSAAQEDRAHDQESDCGPLRRRVGNEAAGGESRQRAGGGGKRKPKLFTDLSDDEFVSIAEAHMEALNHALGSIDPARVRVHICWGNYEGPHVCGIAMDKVSPVLMKARARHVPFEASNPRHAREWAVFRDRRREIPEDKILVPGVVDSTTNFVERPEAVAQRLERFIEIAGAERAMAGSDCGFGAVDPDIAYAKLEALAQGAEIASSRAAGKPG